MGPLFYRAAPQYPIRARLLAVVLLTGCALILIVASRLDPSESGVGTHQQLGLAPCITVMLFGYPCPTCGMTTAFSYAIRGRFLQAFHAQPAGFAAALAVAAAGALSISVLLTGKVWFVNWYRVAPTRITLAIVLIVLGGWAYKLVAGLATGSLPVVL